MREPTYTKTIVANHNPDVVVLDVALVIDTKSGKEEDFCSELPICAWQVYDFGDDASASPITTEMQVNGGCSNSSWVLHDRKTGACWTSDTIYDNREACIASLIDGLRSKVLA